MIQKYVFFSCLLEFSCEYSLLKETLEIAMVCTYVQARFTVIYCDATNAREMNKRKKERMKRGSIVCVRTHDEGLKSYK